MTNLVAVGKSGWSDGRMKPRGSRAAGSRSIFWKSAAPPALAAGALSLRPAVSPSPRPLLAAAACAAMTRRGAGVQLSLLPRAIEFVPIR